MPAAILKTTMKKQIILLVSLLVVSFQTFANESVFEPIPCEIEEGDAMVEAMVAQESLPTWKESFKAAGEKLKARIDLILNNTGDAALRTNYKEVQFLLKKASCVRAVGTGMAASDEFMANWKKYTKEIEFKSGKNFLKMPGDPQTTEQINQVNNFRIVYYNREAYAFLRAIVE